MSIFNVGRICVKIAGRDAGRKCVVVEELDNTFVLVDGDVRRKKVNVKHLEPLAETIELRKGASHENVAQAFTEHSWPTWEHKSKEAKERPLKKRRVKVKPAEKKVK